MANRKRGQAFKKHTQKTITLYTKNQKIWTRAKECADSFDDSLSEYVEIAVNALNMGRAHSCACCEKIRQVLKVDEQELQGR